jgi:hypothetical protein
VRGRHPPPAQPQPYFFFFFAIPTLTSLSVQRDCLTRRPYFFFFLAAFFFAMEFVTSFRATA